MSLHQQLLDLENRLLQAEVRADREKLRALLAEDFFEFGASGSTWHRSEVLQRLPGDEFVERSISDFSIKRLSDVLVLATYRCRRAETGEQPALDSRRSSIWRFDQGRWQMIFHQGTQVPA